MAVPKMKHFFFAVFVFLVTLLSFTGHAVAWRTESLDKGDGELSIDGGRHLLQGKKKKQGGGKGGRGGGGGGGGSASGGGNAGKGGGGGGGGKGGSSVKGKAGDGGDAGNGGKGGDAKGGGNAGDGGNAGKGGDGGNSMGGGTAGDGGSGGVGGEGGAAVGTGKAGDGGLGGSGGKGGSSFTPPVNLAPPMGGGGSTLSCGINQYSKDGDCEKCLAANPPYTLRTQQCLLPYARNGPPVCGFGSLFGIEYEDEDSPTCFDHDDGTKFKGRLYLPVPGFEFYKLTSTAYLPKGATSSVTLDGYPGKVRGNRSRGGLNFIEFEFKSPGPEDLRGETMQLNGIIVAGGKNICFFAEVDVCP